MIRFRYFEEKCPLLIIEAEFYEKEALYEHRA